MRSIRLRTGLRTGLRVLLLALPLAAALLVPAPASAQAPTDLLLSEYVEGSSNNKALEIFNGTGAAIDLALGGYQLQVHFNGNPVPTLTLNLVGVVAAGDVFVVASSAAGPAILAVADQTSGAGLWNGDDAIVLRKAGAVVDSLGQAGVDPGAEWGTGVVSTADNTIRRKAAVCAGDTIETDPFDPAIEWDGFANDTFDGLGAHAVSCVAPAPPWVINELLADPSATAGDANGDGTINVTQDEFVEIVNNTGSSQDISGWTLSDAVGVRHVFPAGSVIADGCAVVVFAGGTPTGAFGGVVVQTASTGQLGLNNGGDTVTLDDGVADVASAAYGAAGGNDQSLTLDPDVTGAAFVLHSIAAGSGGALFSPGTRVDGTSFAGCEAPPDAWVINEIHADPSAVAGDANGDGTISVTQDEFVEIVNASGADQDISGWTLSDAVGVRHVFPAGTVVTDGCAVLVFAGGTPTGSFGNVVVQTASTGQLGLNNGGDTVTFADGGAIATATYGAEGGGDESLTRDPDITGAGFVLHSDAAGSGGALYSPGTRVDGTSFAGCVAPPAVAEIYEIQGAGLVSPFATATVSTLGNVVTAVAPNGFFMQTPDARADLDPETSNGIFVFTGAAPTVVEGDEVDVTGQVVEFFEFTEFSNSPLVTLITSGNPLPAAVAFDSATPSPVQPQPATEYERYEGMLVTVTGGRIGSGNQRFGTDPIAEAFAVAGPNRPFREPGVEFPGLPGLPVFDSNPEVFELDPDKLGLPNLVLTGGSTYDAVGVVGFEFGGYELWPSFLDVTFEAPLPVPVTPEQPDEMTVGSLNLFRLFDDVDDPGSQDNGAVASAAEYQRRLDKFSLYIRDVMGSPDVVAVEEAEKLGVLEDLADVIAADDPAVQYTAFLVEGNDVGGIDTGYLVRDTVNVLAVTQLQAGEIFSVDGSLLHDRPPLQLDAEYVGHGGAFPFTVIALHQRSLSGIEDPVDGPRVRQKRLEQAQSVAQIVQDLQTGDPGIHLLVIGDLNAFEFSDGYVDVVGQIAGDFDPSQSQLSGPDLVSPDLAKLTLGVIASERYSFNFQGDVQAIDHALSSVALTALVTSVEYARGNCDAAADLIFDDTTPLRSSDHDGLVVYIDAGPGDADGDGVLDDADQCTATAIPEGVPTVRLLPLHYALVTNDGEFDTRWPPFGGVVPGGITVEDTRGCSCEQIIDELGLGNGHKKFGCSLGVMLYWIYVAP